MASIYDIKPQFQSILRPLTNRLAASGVTANHVTIFAAALSIATGFAIYAGRRQHEMLLLLPIVLFVRMALNAIDGMLAREHNMKSALGAILNELGDVVSDTALYLPLAVVPGFRPTMIVLIVILAGLSEMAGVVAAQIGASRRYDGPMGKSDRAFAFGALGLALGCGIQPGKWLDVFLGAMIVLLIMTVRNRARKALAEVGQ
jgi:CDP-diacylglycerol---glycerol-3-phosphate 3-phosphatidyltransferase